MTTLAPRFVEVEFAATKIRFYPLNLLQIQEMQEDLTAVTSIREGKSPFDPEVFRKLVRLFTSSAKRGNEAITESIVGELLDLDTMGTVMRAVLGTMPKDDGSNTGAPNLVPTSPQIGGGSTHA